MDKTKKLELLKRRAERRKLTKLEQLKQHDQIIEGQQTVVEALGKLYQLIDKQSVDLSPLADQIAGLGKTFDLTPELKAIHKALAELKLPADFNITNLGKIESKLENLAKLVTPIVPNVKHVPIRQTKAGMDVVVEATNKRIKVINYTFIVAGEGTVQFLSGGQSITGSMKIAENGGVATQGDLFATNANDPLVINTTTPTNGHLSYYVS